MPSQNKRALKLDSSNGGARLQRGHRAALDKDLLGQRDADGFAGRGSSAGRRVPALDGFDRAGLVGRRKNKSIANFDRAGFDAPGQDAALVKPVNVLDRKAQRLILRQLGHFEFVQRFQHGRPLPPGHVRAASGDVVAVLGRNRNEQLRLDADALEQRAIFPFDLVEAFDWL